jgi:hypothetical protein
MLLSAMRFEYGKCAVRRTYCAYSSPLLGQPFVPNDVFSIVEERNDRPQFSELTVKFPSNCVNLFAPAFLR